MILTFYVLEPVARDNRTNTFQRNKLSKSPKLHCKNSFMQVFARYERCNYNCRIMNKFYGNK